MDSLTPCRSECTLASTGTRAPARTFTSSGVITIAPTVDAVVISTDSATSPWAMYVATFDAWHNREVAEVSFIWPSEQASLCIFKGAGSRKIEDLRVHGADLSTRAAGHQDEAGG